MAAFQDCNAFNIHISVSSTELIALLEARALFVPCCAQDWAWAQSWAIVTRVAEQPMRSITYNSSRGFGAGGLVEIGIDFVIIFFIFNPLLFNA